MWRSFFLAVGIMLIVVGIECLMIDSASLFRASEASAGDYFVSTGPLSSSTRTFVPSEWLPWSLMGAGTLIILYAITIRARALAGGGDD